MNRETEFIKLWKWKVYNFLFNRWEVSVPTFIMLIMIAILLTYQTELRNKFFFKYHYMSACKEATLKLVQNNESLNFISEKDAVVKKYCDCTYNSWNNLNKERMYLVSKEERREIVSDVITNDVFEYCMQNAITENL